MLGNTPQIPFRLPYTSQAPSFTIPDAERSLADFADIEVWAQPDAGNVLVPSPKLRIASRFGAWTLDTDGPNISIGSGLAEATEVLTISGGNDAGQEPPHVPGFTFSGDYFAAVLLKFDDAADMGAVHHIFSAGIAGTATALQCYNNGGALFLKHGANNNSQAGVFAQGGEYLVLVTYDSEADKARAYVNSLTPVGWGGAENVAGPAGGDQELTIGARWDGAKVGMNQALDGVVRAVWAGRAPWGAARYDGIRSAFLQRVASLYSDITLA